MLPDIVYVAAKRGEIDCAPVSAIDGDSLV
jgi:hypothetical protein